MISIAGTQIPLEIPEISDWMDRWFTGSLSWPVPNSMNLQSQEDCAASVEPQFPLNWTWHKPLGLNEWFYPTGASRWGYGFFLATKEIYDSIVTDDSQRSPKTLVYGDSTFNNCFVLGPYPISGGSNLASDQLLIIPLVDDRYWWQFQTLDIGSGSSWADLLSNGGISTVSTIESAYLTPDPDELTRVGVNKGFALDIAANSIGHRIVRNPDGTYKSQNYLDATTDQNARVDANPRIFGNRQIRNMTVSSVRMYFRKRVDGKPLNDGSRVEIQRNSVDDSSRYYAIHSTLFADWSTRKAYLDNPSTPDNLSQIDALADQAFLDFPRWAAKEWDNVVVPGTISTANLRINGFDDFVLFRAGQVDEHNSINHHTSVAFHRLPENFQNPVQMTGTTASDCDGTLIRVGLVTETISPFSTGGKVRILDKDGSTFLPEVDAEDNTNSNYLLPGEYGEFVLIPDSDPETWVTVGSRGLVRRGTVITAPINVDSSGTVRLRRGNSLISPNVDLTAFHRLGDSPIQHESDVKIKWMQQEGTTDSDGGRVGEWTIINWSDVAKWIIFSLTSTLSKTDQNADVSVVSYHDGTNPQVNGAITSIKNLPDGTNYVFKGSTGQQGIALYDDLTNTYTIANVNPAGDDTNQVIQQAVCIAKIEPLSTTGTVKLLDATGSPTGSAFAVEELTNSNFILPGERLEVVENETESRWEVVGSRGLYRRGVVITSPISLGSTGTVRLHRNDTIISPNTDITARNREFDYPIQHEYSVRIRYLQQEGTADSDSIYPGEWVIVGYTPPASWIKFTLSGSLDEDDATASITLDSYHNGPDPEVNGAITSINNLPKAGTNKYLFEGGNGDKGKAVYDANDNSYTIDQLERTCT